MGKLKDLTGQTFGRLTVIKREGSTPSKAATWSCSCNCGNPNMVVIPSSSLIGGHTKSCGCLHKEILQSKSLDITGEVFGKLTALEKSHTETKLKGSIIYWKCQCSCDKESAVVVPLSALRSGNTQSCGCKGGETKLIDLTNQVFGRLTVIKFARKEKTNFGYNYYWLCKCSCNEATLVEVDGSNLRIGCTQSCGCLHKEQLIERSTKHGHSPAGSTTPEYRAYSGAKGRCNNPNGSNYANYGGRGIKFLFTSFEEFYSHVGDRPSSEYSLDRIDVNGNYEIGNVRWATLKEQANNKRPYKTITQICDKYNTTYEEIIKILDTHFSTS